MERNTTDMEMELNELKRLRDSSANTSVAVENAIKFVQRGLSASSMSSMECGTIGEGNENQDQKLVRDVVLRNYISTALMGAVHKVIKGM